MKIRAITQSLHVSAVVRGDAEVHVDTQTHTTETGLPAAIPTATLSHLPGAFPSCRTYQLNLPAFLPLHSQLFHTWSSVYLKLCLTRRHIRHLLDTGRVLSQPITAQEMQQKANTGGCVVQLETNPQSVSSIHSVGNLISRRKIHLKGSDISCLIFLLQTHLLVKRW